jgi:hypothetical protein
VSATVSACVIARDEEEHLPGCLDSLAFCDETVVVDGGSRDATVEVARAAGARVLENPWPGFGAQRNVAIDHATGDWILEIDADERVTPRLREEIETFLAGPPSGIDIAALPLRDRFLGAPLGPSSKYPKYRYRLFRRDVYRHDESRVVHEGLWAFGRAWAFDGDIEHLLATSWREAIGDAWTYARLEAAQAPAISGRDLVVAAVLRPVTKFGYRLILDGGWRDGWRGVLKIGLDCASDVAVVVRQRLGRFEPVPNPSRSVGPHFGQRHVKLGSVRIVALAAGPADTDRAAAWLRRAAAAGADVGLITDAPPLPDPGLHVRVVDGVGPLAVLRALDAENQLRPVDALVAAGGRARRIAGLMPALLRGGRGPAGLERDPAAMERELRENTRGPSGPSAARDTAIRSAE